MCGIIGIISQSEVIEQAIVHQMVTCLKHRGPDARDLFLNSAGNCALGHTRLSIIDLRPGANQPFHSRDGRYVMVFNGEVYNFRQLKTDLQETHGVQFNTTSDTEVVIEAFAVWGEAMATKLEGMFALAIFDQQKEQLFLLRDRLGKKPLYYYSSASLFAFASEIKALLQHPIIAQEKQINQHAIQAFLHLGYIPEPETIYHHIHKFPAGSQATVSESLDIAIKPYWNIHHTFTKEKISDEQQAKKHMTRLLNNAVEKRLISDVPLGTFLSGGTDSSLVTALASKHVSSPLKTFSIGFKDSKFDERAYAHQVAEHLNTDHTEYMLTEHDARELLETYLHHFDEPFTDTSAIPTMLVSKLAHEHVKVVLTGDGGDELFQGYGAYSWANRLDNPFWKLLKSPARLIMKSLHNDKWGRIAHLLEPAINGGIRSHIFSQEQYLFSQKEIAQELLRDNNEFKTFNYNDEINSGFGFTAGEKQALFDLQFYLKDDLLVKVDRASMYYGLECRCPLLDQHVVEYAFSLHNSLKVKKGRQKYLLKEILSDYVPRHLTERTKWGFSVPLAKWLRNDLRYLIDDYLNDHVIDEVNLFNKHYIHKLKHAFFSEKDYLYNRLWAIIVLHKWLKENS